MESEQKQQLPSSFYHHQHQHRRSKSNNDEQYQQQHYHKYQFGEKQQQQYLNKNFVTNNANGNDENNSSDNKISPSKMDHVFFLSDKLLGEVPCLKNLKQKFEQQQYQQQESQQEKNDALSVNSAENVNEARKIKNPTSPTTPSSLSLDISANTGATTVKNNAFLPAKERRKDSDLIGVIVSIPETGLCKEEEQLLLRSSKEKLAIELDLPSIGTPVALSHKMSLASPSPSQTMKIQLMKQQHTKHPLTNKFNTSTAAATQILTSSHSDDTKTMFELEDFFKNNLPAITMVNKKPSGVGTDRNREAQAGKIRQTNREEEMKRGWRNHMNKDKNKSSDKNREKERGRKVQHSSKSRYNNMNNDYDSTDNSKNFELNSSPSSQSEQYVKTSIKSCKPSNTKAELLQKNYEKNIKKLRKLSIKNINIGIKPLKLFGESTSNEKEQKEYQEQESASIMFNSEELELLKIKEEDNKCFTVKGIKTDNIRNELGVDNIHKNNKQLAVNSFSEREKITPSATSTMCIDKTVCILNLLKHKDHDNGDDGDGRYVSSNRLEENPEKQNSSGKENNSNRSNNSNNNDNNNNNNNNKNINNDASNNKNINKNNNTNNNYCNNNNNSNKDKDKNKDDDIDNNCFNLNNDKNKDTKPTNPEKERKEIYFLRNIKQNVYPREQQYKRNNSLTNEQQQQQHLSNIKRKTSFNITNVVVVQSKEEKQIKQKELFEEKNTCIDRNDDAAEVIEQYNNHANNASECYNDNQSIDHNARLEKSEENHRQEFEKKKEKKSESEELLEELYGNKYFLSHRKSHRESHDPHPLQQKQKQSHQEEDNRHKEKNNFRENHQNHPNSMPFKLSNIKHEKSLRILCDDIPFKKEIIHKSYNSNSNKTFTKTDRVNNKNNNNPNNNNNKDDYDDEDNNPFLLHKNKDLQEITIVKEIIDESFSKFKRKKYNEKAINQSSSNNNNSNNICSNLSKIAIRECNSNSSEASLTMGHSSQNKRLKNATNRQKEKLLHLQLAKEQQQLQNEYICTQQHNQLIGCSNKSCESTASPLNKIGKIELRSSPNNKSTNIRAHHNQKNNATSDYSTNLIKKRHSISHNHQQNKEDFLSLSPLMEEGIQVINKEENKNSTNKNSGYGDNGYSCSLMINISKQERMQKQQEQIEENRKKILYSNRQSHQHFNHQEQELNEGWNVSCSGYKPNGISRIDISLDNDQQISEYLNKNHDIGIEEYYSAYKPN